MPLGGRHPLPRRVGGGPTRVMKAHVALRDAVGGQAGGSVGPPHGIEDSWRLARARGLASLTAFDERAATQAFPDRATDHVPEYEELLKLTPPTGSADETRRQAIVEKWTRQIHSDVPGILTELEAIDDRFSITQVPDDHSGTTILGRAFEAFVPTAFAPAFNLNPSSGKSTQYPNYADDFVLVIFFDIGAGVVPGAENRRSMQRARELLNEVLPAWVTYRIITEIGFILNQSLLDIGAFGPPP